MRRKDHAEPDAAAVGARPRLLVSHMPGNRVAAGRIVRFGVLDLDLRSGELRKSGVRIPLQDQPFRILVRLLEQPGEVVTRDELREQLWPADTFVDFEHGLNAAVKRLRDALGDAANVPRFIETLPRRGYRFIAPVQHGSRGGAAVPTEGAGTAPVEAIRSVVVLPIVHDVDPALEYLADALTEAIIHRISAGTNLRVIARTTASMAASREADPQKIGQLLFVDAVMVGRLRRAGQLPRLSAEMLRVSDASLLFGFSVSGQSQDAAELEREIPARVIQELQRRVERVSSRPQPARQTKRRQLTMRA